MAETHGISSFGLRKRLAWGVLPPVALLLFLNAFWSYRGAVDATNRAYDRSLNASLNSIAENIHATGGVVSVDIPYSALDVSEGGIQERVYYAIIAPDGSLLTGDKGLAIPTMKALIEEPVIIDTVFRGQPVRLATLRKRLYDPALTGGDVVTVLFAETTDARASLALSLFLDSLREQLEEAGDSPRKLLNLRNRMARIRVFDPACGSGNFLVIAYKEMRKIEAEINRRRGEEGRVSDIPLTNFRGIELRDFPAEIARLALIIAEYQCDVLYRGKQFALAEFLPLNNENWITCGNALQLDWLDICPPTGTVVKVRGDDLFQTPLDQSEIDFENVGGETYICGNPPYAGHQQRTAEQKREMEEIFALTGIAEGDLDYVLCWVELWRRYSRVSECSAAFVMTNSVCQGRQVPRFWKPVIEGGCRIAFAHTSFIWGNNASRNAAVVCVVVGLGSGLIAVARR